MSRIAIMLIVMKRILGFVIIITLMFLYIIPWFSRLVWAIGNCDMYFDKESFQTMLASEEVLGWDWNSPDEDKAWSYLSDRKE